MSPLWRNRPETIELVEQSKRLREEMASVVDKLDAYVAALNEAMEQADAERAEGKE